MLYVLRGVDEPAYRAVHQALRGLGVELREVGGDMPSGRRFVVTPPTSGKVDALERAAALRRRFPRIRNHFLMLRVGRMNTKPDARELYASVGLRLVGSVLELVDASRQSPQLLTTFKVKRLAQRIELAEAQRILHDLRHLRACGDSADAGIVQAARLLLGLPPAQSDSTAATEGAWTRDTDSLVKDLEHAIARWKVGIDADP